jgi:hypothetical protein
MYGAEVIRLESSARMDAGRGARPMPQGKFAIERSARRSTGQPRQMVTFNIVGSLPSSIEVNP